MDAPPPPGPDGQGSSKDPPTKAARTGLRALTIDIGPLLRHRDYRLLYLGQFVSFLGTMMTHVALPYQVYALTHSSLAVGLLGLAFVRGPGTFAEQWRAGTLEAMNPLTFVITAAATLTVAQRSHVQRPRREVQ